MSHLIVLLGLESCEDKLCLGTHTCAQLVGSWRTTCDAQLDAAYCLQPPGVDLGYGFCPAEVYTTTTENSATSGKWVNLQKFRKEKTLES
eukprot:4512118-Amphidinium_carterae.1